MKIEIGPGGFKNTRFVRPQPTNWRDERGVEEDEMRVGELERMAQTADEKGDVEGGLELLDMAAKLRRKN